MATLHDYFHLMVEHTASDLYLTANAPAAIKLRGALRSINNTLLTADQVKELAVGAMNAEQQEKFAKELELNFGIEEPGVGSFRVNVYQQRGNVAMVVRLIPAKIPSLDQLGLPEVFKKLVMLKRGLILVTGATGVGKSTTLASMIDYRNQNTGGHIISVEDPIEFVHQHKKSIVSQREIGIDTHSYQSALENILREAPDVILIGEIRTRDVMEKVMQLSETGHLCLSTLHSSNSIQAIDRIINLYPLEAHKQLLLDLSLNLRAIISQRLLTTVDGEQVAAFEIMVITTRIAEIIRSGNIVEIKELLHRENEDGMQSFDDDLYRLYKENRISMEEALQHADSAHDLKVKIGLAKGVSVNNTEDLMVDNIKKPQI